MIRPGWVVCALTSIVCAIKYNPEPQNVPQYVVDNSPVIYLYSEEEFLPGSIDNYVRHFRMSNSKHNLSETVTLPTLHNLSLKAQNDGHSQTYLTSKSQWQHNPAWVTGKRNVPNLSNDRIGVPATLIVVDKGEYLDAFWFYFYPFNLGPFVMGRGPYGNHLGDWEHTLVRFRNGKPELIWMSAHGGGSAYKWGTLDGLDNNEQRPILFAARGTHAHYVSVGQHSHDIPWHMLSDFTDRGELWDPAKNFVAYTFDGSTVHPANGTIPGREREWGDWLLFEGCWGNKQLDPKDSRQAWSIWEWRIIDGPTGPLSKNLMRTKPCERHKWWNILARCRVRHTVTPGEGVEAELRGCKTILGRLPEPFATIASWVFKGGYLCFTIDLFN